MVAARTVLVDADGPLRFWVRPGPSLLSTEYTVPKTTGTTYRVLNYFDWDLSPEQRMIQRVVREFVERDAMP